MNPEILAETAKLVVRCQLGDERAWGKLVDRYRNLVYSIPRRMGLGSEDAEEVFQAAWVALYKSLDRIEEPATVGKWLAVTASRESLRLLRIRKREPALIGDSSTLDETLAAEEATAEEAAVGAESSDTVRAAVLGMSDKCRELLSALYLSDDPKYHEIAESLGMPIGSIGPTRARCLEKLRSELSKSGFFNESLYQAPGVGARTEQKR